MAPKTFTDLYNHLISAYHVDPKKIEDLVLCRFGQTFCSEDNVWQFLHNRKLPTCGGNMIPFQPNIGTFCAIWCAEHGAKNIWIELPRCSFVSHTMFLYRLYLDMYRTNTRINTISGSQKAAESKYASLRRCNDIIAADPNIKFINTVNFIEDFEQHNFDDVKRIIEDTVGPTVNIMWSVPLLKSDTPMITYMYGKFRPFAVSMINEGDIPANVHIKFYASKIHEDEYFKFNNTALPPEVYQREVLLNRNYGISTVNDAEGIYLVNYFNGDHDSRYIFRDDDEENAKWCKKFYEEKMKAECDKYRQFVELLYLMTETTDFKQKYDDQIAEMNKQQEKKLEKTKQEEIDEYYRIKEKYNL